MVDISASPPWGPSGHEIQIWSTYPIHPFHHGQQIASLAPSRRPHSPGTLQNPIEDECPRPSPPRKCCIGCSKSSRGYKDGCPDQTPLHVAGLTKIWIGRYVLGPAILGGF